MLNPSPRKQRDLAVGTLARLYHHSSGQVGAGVAIAIAIGVESVQIEVHVGALVGWLPGCHPRS